MEASVTLTEASVTLMQASVTLTETSITPSTAPVSVTDVSTTLTTDVVMHLRGLHIVDKRRCQRRRGVDVADNPPCHE